MVLIGMTIFSFLSIHDYCGDSPCFYFCSKREILISLSGNPRPIHGQKSGPSFAGRHSAIGRSAMTARISDFQGIADYTSFRPL
jgi:hypothetical protein